MGNTDTALKKKYHNFKIRYPKMSAKDYRESWQNLEKLGKKLNQLWEVKKNSLEIIKEERS